jgi:putative peptidoglycan lipid II flippase
VLYAALTGLWPGELGDGLPAAPADTDGSYRSPRQVRAGIPGHLDDLCRQLLAPHAAAEDSRLRTPADAAAALATRHGSAGSHIPHPPPLRRREPTHSPVDSTQALPAAGPAGTGRALRLLRGVVVLLVAVGLGLALWQFAVGAIRGPQSPDAADRAQAASGGRPAAAHGSGAVIKVAKARDFDPPPAGNGEENGDEAPLAVDGDPATSWQTQTYFDPLELQKPGIGLILDLGSAAQVGSVHLRLVGSDTDVELRAAAADATSPPAHLGGFDRVVDKTTAATSVTLRPKAPVRTRYLLVWLTRLPAAGSDYRGGIAEAVVHAP